MSDFLSGALGVLNTAKGITGGIAQFDPINLAVTAGCDLLGLPSEVKNAVKIGVGIATGDYLVAIDGAVGLAQDIAEHQAGETEYWNGGSKAAGTSSGSTSGYGSSSSAATCSGYAPSRGAAAPDPRDAEYKKALWTMEKNFEDFDRGMYIGFVEGKVATDTLGAWEKSSDPEKRQVAQFFKNNPEYLARLDDVDGTRGSFFKPAVQSEISRLNAESARYAQSAESGKRGEAIKNCDTLPTERTCPEEIKPYRPPGSHCGELNDILSDPTLSAEEKILLILQMVGTAMDEQAVIVAGQLAGRAVARAALADEAGKSGATQESKEALSRHDSGTEMLTLQVQRLTEKRKQMFEMSSNLSSNFNSMANAAIQNMGRA